jgi:ATP-dependent DNA helicase RecG
LTYETIQKLLAEGEGWTVEYKECRYALSNSVFETICSFSNRYGGYILLGVADNGTVQGVKQESVAGIKKNFVNMLNNPQKISPTMFLSLEEIEIDGKLLLYVYVPIGSQVELCSGKICLTWNYYRVPDFMRKTNALEKRDLILRRFSFSDAMM